MSQRRLPAVQETAHVRRARDARGVGSVLSDPTPLEPPDFDPAALLCRLHGNHAQFVRLLQAFSAQHGDSGAEIGRFVRQGEIDRARHALHALKGVSAALGLRALASAAHATEEALQKGSVGRDPSQLWRTVAMLARLNDDAIVAIAQCASPGAVPTGWMPAGRNGKGVE